MTWLNEELDNFWISLKYCKIKRTRLAKIKSFVVVQLGPLLDNQVHGIHVTRQNGVVQYLKNTLKFLFDSVSVCILTHRSVIMPFISQCVDISTIVKKKQHCFHSLKHHHFIHFLLILFLNNTVLAVVEPPSSMAWVQPCLDYQDLLRKSTAALGTPSHWPNWFQNRKSNAC